MTYELINGYVVWKLVSNPDKTVTLNDEKTMTLKEYHSLGGFAAPFHEHAMDGRHRYAFAPYRK